MGPMGPRRPCAAGTFYPADPDRLTDEVERALGPGYRRPASPLSEPAAAILPHAGYVYSGAVAGAGYRALAALGRPAAAVILGTNHTGLGGPIAVAEPGTWLTPFGEVPIPEDLSCEVAKALGAVQSDLPFAREHSVEVQLPFLQHLFGPLPVVPVVVQPLSPAAAERAGRALGNLLSGQPVFLLASTDFTHYEPDPMAREKDRKALEPILRLDLEGFLQAVARYRISICGVGAIALLLAAARALGLTEADLLSYRTSGEVGGYLDEVVGYAAVLFRKGDTGA